MKALILLYPRAWRARYGDELLALIARQPVSVALVIDVIAGAIDAWIHPRAWIAHARPAAAGKGKDSMAMRLTGFRCVGSPASVTPQDERKSLAVTLGGTVALTLVWMRVRVAYGDNPFVDALSVMAFLIPMMIGMRWTYLKGRAATVQAIFILGNLLVVAALLLAAGWLAARL